MSLRLLVCQPIQCPSQYRVQLPDSLLHIGIPPRMRPALRPCTPHSLGSRQSVELPQTGLRHRRRHTSKIPRHQDLQSVSEWMPTPHGEVGTS